MESGLYWMARRRGLSRGEDSRVGVMGTVSCGTRHQYMIVRDLRLIGTGLDLEESTRGLNAKVREIQAGLNLSCLFSQALRIETSLPQPHSADR
jgi:hypothetical protein